MKVTDYDIIYLSYDEPNAEKNYADLLSKVPWAKRVHGVEGSDAAHKACAEMSETERLIIVDGDNVIDPEFAETVYDNIKVMAIERMESQNVPDEVVTTMMERLDENNPFELWSQVKNFFFGTAFSAILGLIVAAAMKKKNPAELV